MQSLGNIGFIGGGNMGSCLIGGLIKKGYPKQHLLVSDHGADTCRALQQTWDIYTTAHNLEMAKRADILVLAVKPQHLKNVLLEIASEVPTSILIISIAAGITTVQIKRWLGNAQANVIRAMPNTPALLGHGITGLFAAKNISHTQRQQAEQLLSCVGETVWVEEEGLMDVVTALSGSGPAYFFYMMECLIKAGSDLGLPEEISSKLTLHTALGSALMALNSKEDILSLREKVTSKGGTTEQGINTLKDGKLAALIANVLKAATLRGQSLSEQYD